MWLLSPPWKDPLAPAAPGRVRQSEAGLRARVLGHGSRTLVFLHGLGASLRYWGRSYDGLASFGRLVFLDLLGFAGSQRPSGRYDTDHHVPAIRNTLEELEVADAVVVGHSTGGLSAMALGAHSPSLVFCVVGCGVPIFPSEEAARKHIRSLGFMARLMADDLPLGRRICRFMCDHRELARSVAPLLAPRLPAPVEAYELWVAATYRFRSQMANRFRRRRIASAGSLGKYATITTEKSWRSSRMN